MRDLFLMETGMNLLKLKICNSSENTSRSEILCS
jgi:hypothetical protein